MSLSFNMKSSFLNDFLLQCDCLLCQCFQQKSFGFYAWLSFTRVEKNLGGEKSYKQWQNDFKKFVMRKIVN